MELLVMVQKRGSYEISYVPTTFAVIDDGVCIDQCRLSSGLRQQQTLTFSDRQIEPAPVPHLSNDNAGEEVLDVDFKGEPVDVGYNPRYLTEIIKAMGPAENIEILFTGASTGTLMSATDCSQLKFVLMPLRI